MSVSQLYFCMSVRKCACVVCVRVRCFPPPPRSWVGSWSWHWWHPCRLRPRPTLEKSKALRQPLYLSLSSDSPSVFPPWQCGLISKQEDGRDVSKTQKNVLRQVKKSAVSICQDDCQGTWSFRRNGTQHAHCAFFQVLHLYVLICFLK